MPSRRQLAAVLTTALLLAGCAGEQAPPRAESTPTASPTTADVSADLRRLEQEYAVRLGVAALDTESGVQIAHREGERFGFASTIKAFVAAAFLAEVPAGERDRVVRWTPPEVEAAGYSPVTEQTDRLPLAELAEAAVRESDNTATNLVLREIGGPGGLTRVLRELGDRTTRSVNDEPALNEIEPGSADDTSTPAALATSLRAVLEDDLLSPADRETWLDWMSGNATGDTLVRAGAPAGWKVADKSGGAGGLRHDLAIVTPPGRAPIVLAVMSQTRDPEAEYDDAVVAAAAKVVLDALR
ncbi:class A beta-lactamase [Alteromonas gracilis]